MKLEIKNQQITVTEREPLVSGSVNVYTAEFSFDSAWDGYTPVAVFESTGVRHKVSREVAITDGKCTVPWETLLPNSYLKIGVYGVNGDKRLPTIYADSQSVARGTAPADPAAEPTPGVVEQIVSQVSEDRVAAESAADRAEEAATRQPYPNAETGTWWVWDAESGEYKDSGIASAGAVQAMTATTLGGAIADPAEEEDTQPVRIGADNKLYTTPGGGISLPTPTAEDAGKVPMVNGDGTGYELGSVLEPENVSGWETIADITTEEEMSLITINTDADGKSFELIEAEMLIEITGTGSNESDAALTIRTNINTAALGGSNSSAVRMFRPSTGVYRVTIKIYCRSGVIAGMINNIGNEAHVLAGYYNPNFPTLKAIFLYGGIFGIGTHIVLRGIRA